MPHLRYLEFYAGVGGWTMALQKAVANVNTATEGQRIEDAAKPFLTTECVAAFDHSDLCITVYHHNFALVGCDSTDGVESMHSIKIEKLTLSDLIRFNADIWMMSPPCQPHTRQHNNQSNDIIDTRSNSFLHLCRLLNDMELSKDARPPSIILLENVVGFESSNSCQVWIETLLTCHYRIAQLHLQPTQVGVPNDRPRYYCAAVRNNDSDRIYSGGGLAKDTTSDDGCEWMSKYFSNPGCSTDCNLNLHISLQELGVTPEDKIQYDDLPMLSLYLDTNINDSKHIDLCVCEALLNRPAAWCLDIVTPSSRRSSCFTSAYGKYAKGTGSVLLQNKNTSRSSFVNGSPSSNDSDNKYKMIPPEERQYDPNWASTLMDDGCYLRYFSGDELKRLFGFTDAFTFPNNTTLKQQWKLIGNSLNVNLTSTIVELALRTCFNIPQRMSK
jgi:tRNA (cytosine38-C5)-methyltransferase